MNGNDTQTEEKQGLIDDHTKQVVRLTCQQLGVLPDTITSKEVIDKHGRAFYEKMKRSDMVRKAKKGGHSAKIIFNYNDYLEYLLSSEV